jgi:hypothetical protein
VIFQDSLAELNANAQIWRALRAFCKSSVISEIIERRKVMDETSHVFDLPV